MPNKPTKQIHQSRDSQSAVCVFFFSKVWEIRGCTNQVGILKVVRGRKSLGHAGLKHVKGWVFPLGLIQILLKGVKGICVEHIHIYILLLRWCCHLSLHVSIENVDTTQNGSFWSAIFYCILHATISLWHHLFCSPCFFLAEQFRLNVLINPVSGKQCSSSVKFEP